MASVNDYGKDAAARLDLPPLGGPDGWAAAVAAALSGSDVPIDTRLAAKVNKAGDTMTGALDVPSLIAAALTAATADVSGLLTADQFKSARAIEIGSTNLNDLVGTGFFDGSNLVNAPGNSNGWHYIVQVSHSNPAQYRMQIATTFYQPRPGVYVRVLDGGVWSPWHSIFNGGSVLPTMASGFAAVATDGTYVHEARRHGNMVTLSMTCKRTTTGPSGGYSWLVATVPSGYRPIGYAHGMANMDNGTSPLTSFWPGSAVVYPNGEVRVIFSQGITPPANATLRIMVTYQSATT